MNRTQRLGIGALVLAIVGCVDNKSLNIADEYKITPKVSAEKPETFSELEGRIVKVQPSQLAYFSEHNSQVSASHEFVYVIVEGQDEKSHTFIYPYSKAILEREARIKFRPLESGMIDADTLIDTFVNQRYCAANNIFLEAEGLITRDGIEYK
jgi:hypothetical protein